MYRRLLALLRLVWGCLERIGRIQGGGCRLGFDVKAYGAVQDVRLLFVLEIITLPIVEASRSDEAEPKRARAKLGSASRDYVA